MVGVDPAFPDGLSGDAPPEGSLSDQTLPGTRMMSFSHW